MEVKWHRRIIVKNKKVQWLVCLSSKVVSQPIYKCYVWFIGDDIDEKVWFKCSHRSEIVPTGRHIARQFFDQNFPGLDLKFPNGKLYDWDW